jgi:hypothetical protein
VFGTDGPEIVRKIVKQYFLKPPLVAHGAQYQ